MPDHKSAERIYFSIFHLETVRQATRLKENKRENGEFFER